MDISNVFVTKTYLGIGWLILVTYKLQKISSLILLLYAKGLEFVIIIILVSTANKTRLDLADIILETLILWFLPGWQEPEPSHVTGMALAHCILGKFLGVVCHCFPPPLEVPTFAARCLYVRNDARDPSSERWNCGPEIVR